MIATRLDFSGFLRQTALLHEAGIAMIDCLDILSTSQTNHASTACICHIKREMILGKAFHESIACYSPDLDPFILQLIKLGEQTNHFIPMLQAAADYLDHKTLLKKSILKILAYPTLLLIISIMIFISMLLLVVPHFAELFHDQAVVLPLLTRGIFYLSAHCSAFLSIVCASFVIFSIALRPYSISLRRFFLSYLPYVRLLSQQILHIRFARQLALAISSGFSITDAIRLIRHTGYDTTFQRLIMQINHQINAGSSLHQAMASQPSLPKLLSQMIKIGEETDKLDLMLLKFADLLQNQVEQALQRLHLLLEPLIMLVLGALIGGLVIGMYLPVFTLGSAL